MAELGQHPPDEMDGISMAYNVSMMAGQFAVDSLSDAGNNTIASQEGGHVVPHAVLFVFAGCIIGAVVKQVVKLFKLSISETVVLMVMGLGFGFLGKYVPEFGDYTKVAQINRTSGDHCHDDGHSEMIMAVFLPVLLFESAFVMDIHTFQKMLSQILVMAIPGLASAMALTAVMAKQMFVEYVWEWRTCFLFGAIASATDPVACVALLGSLGTSIQLQVLIEGESLLNDAAAIVFFQIFKPTCMELTAKEIGIMVPQLVLGGCAWGFLMGKVTVFWLQHVFNDALVEISITLSMTYVTYFIGDFWFGVSGVLAVVVMGLEVNLNRTSISPEVDAFLNRFWGMLAFLANTLLFLVVGMTIADVLFESSRDFQTVDILYVFVTYLGISIIRLLVTLIYYPLLKRLGYGVNWRHAVIMIWGGLRGAVTVLLAWRTATTSQGEEGNRILLLSCCITLIMLLVNATTLKPLLRILGMSEISSAKQAAMSNAVRRLNESQVHSFSMLKTDRFLADADWQIARRACDIVNPYLKADDSDDGTQEQTFGPRYSNCPECNTQVKNEASKKEYSEMAEEARLSVLKAEKMSFWRQFERGVLCSDAVMVLVNIADTCMDKRNRLIQLSDISGHWRVPKYWDMIKGKLERARQPPASDKVPPPRNLLLRLSYMFATHQAFDIVMNVLIVLNMIPIIWELVVDDSIWYHKWLKLVNYIYCAIYIAEITVKILAFRKYFFKDLWNWLDLFIVIISIVDIIIDTQLDGASKLNTQLLKIAKPFRIIRMGRLMKLVKSVIPKLIDAVNNRINRQLSFGYDIGKGYVVAEGDVAKNIDQLCFDDKIATDLKMRCNKGRLDVVKSLGLLQRQHPGIAISVKTRQAIRSVLNNARDSLNELRANGFLDKMEANRLESAIEVKMKRQLNAPPHIPPKKPEDILRSLVWLQGMEDEAIAYITNNAEMCFFDVGDAIVKQGEECDGVYLIINGMVKLVGISLASGSSSEDLGATGDKPHHETLNFFGKSNLNITVDYLYSGNVIGEMGVMTNGVRNATVTCETIVQAYFVGADKLHRAFVRFLGMAERFWRVCAIRLVVPILMEDMKYKMFSKDYIRVLCENSKMAKLGDSGSSAAGGCVIHITDSIREAFLCQGCVRVYSTKEELTAPCLLPHTSKMFVYDENSPPRLLYIFKLSSSSSDSYTEEIIQKLQRKGLKSSQQARTDSISQQGPVAAGSSNKAVVAVVDNKNTQFNQRRAL